MNPRPLFAAILSAFAAALAAADPDVSNFTPIGPVASVARDPAGVTLSCADGSTVRISILAPDLVRVRAAMRGPLPARDHSWAIARDDWPCPAWTLEQTASSLRLATDELEVLVSRSPCLIEFRDARTHEVINADKHPISFDPRSGAVAAMKRLGLDEHFYGLGEKAARLDKRRGRFDLWNSDTPGYVEGTDPIYQSIPFYQGWKDGHAYGIFFDNSFRTHFDFGSLTQDFTDFWSEGGEMNYYFFWGPSLGKVLGRYADLTGHMPLPPLWALGNQQSRYSYYPDTLAEDIVRRYRADDLPLDVLHLDIHYMNGFRDFTFDPERFPDPRALAGRLRAQGVKLVAIVDPGVKYEPGDAAYPVFTEGLKRGFFLRRADGRLYIGEVWPGKAVFVDYTLDAAARWWGDQHRALLDAGICGIWDDMNEPSDFTDKSGQSQRDVVFDDLGAKSAYASNRNVFALGMARATFEGLSRLRPDLRPYVITRAGYAGIQRYATMWTGDSNSTWDALALCLPMYETLGLSGEPFVGSDIPGFTGRADGELLARWYEVSFLVPFCRNHASIDSYDHEPWRFGLPYEDIVRKYLKLRYRLLPYLYTTLEESHRTGLPVIRPLMLNYQADPNTLDIDDEFMVGGDLLAAPVLRPGQTSRSVYLPEGLWYDFWTGVPHRGGGLVQADAPLDTVPLYVRAGAILPLAPAMNYVGEKPWDVIRFTIYPDARGKASARLYEDDGTSPGYESGAWRRTPVEYEESEAGRRVDLGAPKGAYRPAPRQFEFALAGSPERPVRVVDDGTARRVPLPR